MFRAKLWLATVATAILTTSSESTYEKIHDRFDAIMAMEDADGKSIFTGGHIEQKVDGIGWVVFQVDTPDPD